MFKMMRKESTVMVVISADPDYLYSDIASVNLISNSLVSSHLVIKINEVVFNILSEPFWGVGEWMPQPQGFFLIFSRAFIFSPVLL